MARRGRTGVRTDGRKAASDAHRPADAPLHRLGPYVLLVTLSCVAYCNAGHKDFFFDSPPAILENPLLRDPAACLSAIFRPAWVPDQTLTQFTFALNVQLNQALGLPAFRVTSFLVVNVLIHALNACLVFASIRDILRSVERGGTGHAAVALAAAAIFAVHPLHGSTVVYTLQRRGELVLTFQLLALLAYLRVRPHGLWSIDSRARPAWQRYGLILGALTCFWLSCKAKSLGLVFPLVLLAVEFCLRAGRPGLLKRFAPVVLGAAVLWGLGAVFFLARVNAFDPNNMQLLFAGQKQLWSPWVHFLTECRVLVNYWNLLLLPLPQWMSIDHGYAVSTGLWQYGAAFALVLHLILLITAIGAAFRGWPLASAGLLWYYASLAPYLVLPQAELLVEYKTYPASVGLALILADVFRRILLPGPMPVRVLAAALPIVVLLAITVRRNVVYQDEFNLWSDAVSKCPDRARCQASLGNALLKRGRTKEAVARFEEAIRLLPEYYPAILNLANQFSAEGRIREANQKYEEVLRIEPNYAQAHNNLAVNLVRLERVEEAIGHYREAIRLRPAYLDAHYNLSRALSLVGKNGEAIAEIREAVRLNPESPQARLRLAHLLAGTGQHVEAARHYRAAVALQPDFVEARLDLGNALLDAGQAAEAVVEFEQVIRRRPDWAEAYNCLGSALLAAGETDAARSQLEEALRRDPRHVNARINLGLTLEALDRKDEAARSYEEALRLSPAHPVAAKRLSTLRGGASATRPAGD